MTAPALDYRAARADRLLTLLEDIESWRVIASHAREQAASHPVGSRPHIVLTRLATAVAEVVDLAQLFGEGAA